MNTRTFRLVLALLLGVAAPAFAHEKGVIQLASKAVSIRGELGITGAKLPKNAELRLELRGALEQFPLGIVRTDTAGAFTATLAIPDEVGTGSYAVIALAPDGDVAARAELVVTAAAAEAAAGMAGMEGMQMPGEAPHATAEMMVVPVTTGTLEWGVIGAFVLLSFLGGAALLRDGRRRTV